MYMRFNHAFEFDNQWMTDSAGNWIGTHYYDGGVVEASMDGGTSWFDAGSLFTDNTGYSPNSEIYSGPNPYTPNPYAGSPAFVGNSQGYRSSRMNLAALAGKNAMFRWIVATDGSVGARGWYIDDVRVYRCDAPIAELATNRVLNGSFEVDSSPVDGKPDHWTVPPEVTRVNTVKREGTYSARHYATTNVSYRYSSVWVPLAGHGNYLSALGWYNIPATTDTFGLSFKVMWYNASKTFLREDLIKTVTTHTNGTWAQVAKSFIPSNGPVPPGTAFAVMVVEVSSLNATIYVDDFVFQGA
jgi:hypothetical protein